jgi:hypothetical protein
MDGLDPGVAPGVGTAVRGGLTYREAHLAMELVAESGLLSCLEIVEVNPILDRQNATAALAVELGCQRLWGDNAVTAHASPSSTPTMPGRPRLLLVSSRGPRCAALVCLIAPGCHVAQATTWLAIDPRAAGRGRTARASQ